MAVWNLGKTGRRTVLFEGTIKSAICAYPTALKTSFFVEKNSITIEYSENFMARFFEIEIE